MKETVQYPIRETERVCVCLCLCVCSLAHLNWQSWLQVTKRFGTFFGGWNRKAWESIIVNSCPHRDGWTLAVGVVPPPTQRGAATVHSGADAGNGGKFVSKITKSKRAQTLVLGSMLKKSRRRVWEKILELLVRCWMLLGSLKHNFLLRKPLKVLTAIQVKRLLSWQSCRFLWGFWGERNEILLLVLLVIWAVGSSSWPVLTSGCMCCTHWADALLFRLCFRLPPPELAERVHLRPGTPRATHTSMLKFREVNSA